MKLVLKQWAIYCNYCLISLFVISYIIISILWTWLTGPEQLKPPPAFSNQLLPILNPLVYFAGWEQSWGFFSPNINTNNAYTLITIAKQNGLLRLVELPRVEKLSLLEKLKHEKYRKLFYDNLPNDSYTFIRPDIAKFISRANSTPNNKAERTTFFSVVNAIPPPPDYGTVPKSIRTAHQAGQIEKYFVYKVSADDL